MNENTYKIYKYTNLINGKIYIGQTIGDLKYRAGYNGYKYRKCPYFYNAIQKYGWENFIVEILQDNLTHAQANELEIEYIKKLNSQNPDIGYNISDGGNTNSVLRKKLYQYSLDGEYIKEWESLSEARRFYNSFIDPLLHNSLGYQWSYEKVDKMPPVKDYNNLGVEKKVYKYDLDGNFICEYPSMSEASKCCDSLSGFKHISQCCNNKRRSAMGFRWSFDYVDKLPLDNNILIRHKVAKLNPINNEILEIFDSSVEAANNVINNNESNVKTTSRNIRRCCEKGLKYTCHGYKWQYID